MAEFEKFERLYYQVLFGKMIIMLNMTETLQLAKGDQATLEGTTGCLYPCTYLEYK